MNNVALAKAVLEACARAGVRELVLCAGARNAPLVSLLSHARGVRTYSFFEERSAAFFALGRMLESQRPVAVITTSGTATAELLPAVIEADYQGLPLVVLTADRPRRYRGSGAPQTIVQPGIYSHYVERTWDVEGEWNGDVSVGSRPVHINVCFDEPLLDGPLEAWDWPLYERASLVTNAPSDPVEVPLCRPLVIVGGLRGQDRGRVLELVERWKRPVYAEATSQLRGRFSTEVLEKSLPSLDYDGVIRIGSVPTLRLWRDLETSGLPVYNFSHLPFSGLPRCPLVYPLESLSDYKFEPWLEREVRGERLSALLSEFPLSEPAWVRWISQQLPPHTRLFLGNSLPIREWDLAAQTGGFEVFANRGANGIDGLISTFLGLGGTETSNWGVIGDLSALYDLSGPWALSQRPLPDVNLVIINNGGGKIFHRIFHNALFENQHQLQFADWARMWKLDYLKLERLDSWRARKGPRVIEIFPSNEQTEKFWAAWEALP